MTGKQLGPFNIDRIFIAIRKQRERLLRATQALDRAGVAYAVAGDHAAAYWVGTIDESAVRNAAQIDSVLGREHLAQATAALEAAAFIDHRTGELHAFVDGPLGRTRDAVRVRLIHDAVDAEPSGEFRVLTLNALVRLLLTTFKTVDSMHLRDMLDVGLIDAAWTSRLPPELAARLQVLLDNPEG